MSNPKRDLKRGRVLVAFNCDHGLSRDVDEVGKLLLCHRSDGAELPYRVAETRAHAAIR